MKWEETELGELIDIRHGWAFKGVHFSDIPTNDILLTPGNFHVGGGFKPDKLKYYNGTYPSNYVLNSNDIVVTMTDLSKEADTIGFAAKVPTIEGHKILLNQRIGQVIPKREDFSMDFIYWVMRSYQYQRYVANASRGATVKHTSPTLIRQYRFNLPPLPIQNTIASILSAYDRFIENNLQRIKLLEQAAKSEYKLLLSEFPKYIELEKLAEPIKRGISPKYVLQDGVIVINQKCIRGLNIDFSLSKFTDKQKSIPYERMLRKYDVVINSTGTGTLGRISVNLSSGFDCTVDSHVTIVRAKDVEMSTFLAMALLEQSSIISTMGVGATNQTELSPKRLGQEILIPQVDKESIGLFHKSVSSKFDLIWNLSQQNTQLRQARDILLPKLMSGQIDVSKQESVSKLIPFEAPVVSMVADEAPTYQTKNPKGGAKYYFRTLLAAYIVNNLWQEKTFGHVKLMKLMYLSEHVAHIETISNYHRDAAGPYDNQMIRSIDKQLKDKKWFEMYKKDGKYPKYKPMEKATDFMPEFAKYHSDKQVGIDSLIQQFGSASTEQVEMVATVYEAWRYLSTNNHIVSIDAILNEILNLWHESKTKISRERWITCYEWVVGKGWITNQLTTI